MKKHTEMRIVLAAADVPETNRLARALVSELGAAVTVVGTIGQARALVESGEHDAILVRARFSEASGAGILGEEGSLPKAPVVMLSEETDVGSALEAIRRGASDVFFDPIDLVSLARSIRRAVERAGTIRSLTARTERVRKISKQLVKDRRVLRQKIDLICTDLVEAYRRLAQKVVSMEGGESEVEAEPGFDTCYGEN